MSFVDRVPRNRLLGTGYAMCGVFLTILTILLSQFENSTNRAAVSYVLEGLTRTMSLTFDIARCMCCSHLHVQHIVRAWTRWTGVLLPGRDLAVPPSSTRLRHRNMCIFWNQYPLVASRSDCIRYDRVQLLYHLHHLLCFWRTDGVLCFS